SSSEKEAAEAGQNARPDKKIEARTYQIPEIPATLDPDDPRMLPYVPMLPPSAMIDRPYAAPPSGGPTPAGGEAGVSGDGNELLEGVRKLVATEAPWLL